MPVLCTLLHNIFLMLKILCYGPESLQPSSSRKRSINTIDDESEEEVGQKKEKRKPGKHVTVKEEKKDSSEVVVEVRELCNSILLFKIDGRLPFCYVSILLCSEIFSQSQLNMRQDIVCHCNAIILLIQRKLRWVSKEL